MHMISDPLVKTLLTTKWHRFARFQFSVQAGMYLVLVLVQTFLIWLHNVGSHYSSSQKRVRTGDTRTHARCPEMHLFHQCVLC